MIDVFSKYAVVVPIKEKKGEDVMAAIFKGFELVGKQPEVFTRTRKGHYQTHGSQRSSERQGYNI
jgi:hypothetical protein